MSDEEKNPIVAGLQSVDINAATRDDEISDKTAARLRDLCEHTGESFDTSLTETQALRRIAALEEAHGLS